MGVTGLLQQLKHIQESTSLSKYKGQTLAVDTYGWLHRGLISCAQDLCTDVPTRGYITSVMKKVDMLLHFGVTPVMVFDGSPLPTKEGTHVERRLRREKARDQAQKCLKKGDRKSAWKEFMKAAEVTPEMAKSVMVELDRKHVRYVVAPYEADPQMVYMEKVGVVDGILSEDSDLLVFGCRRLITKLNDYGECVEICRDNLHKVPRMSLHTFTPAQWRLVAILSGCDYTKGVPGVGLKTAFNMVSKISHLEKIVAAFRADNKTVPEEFVDEALKADLAFQYQKVFDWTAGSVTTLCEIGPDSDLDMSVLELCCGRRLDPEIHAGICKGKLHPLTHEPLISREHNLSVARSHSVSAAQTTTAKVASSVSKPVSKSFSNPRSIDCYFKSVNAVAVQSTEPKFAKPDNALKRPSERETQLSPSSKKLRRFQSASVVHSSGGVTQSKFFGSVSSTVPSSIPPVAVSLSCPQSNEPDCGFVTGDSEVPESSSPIRNGAHDGNSGSITDDDDENDAVNDSRLDSCSEEAATASGKNDQDQASLPTQEESDADDGYENELDESPVKTEKLSLSWRKKFAMGASGSDGVPQIEVQRSVSCKKTVASKAQVMQPTNSEQEHNRESGQDEKTFDESFESSSSPHTPEQVLEKRMLGEGSSQIKSSQQTCFSEIDENFDLSPVRRVHVSPQRRSTIKLSQFAFTGR